MGVPMTAHSSSSFVSVLLRSSVATLLLGCPSDEPLALGDTSSGGDPVTSSANICVPGQQVSCPCVGGGEGAQSCLLDGSGFGPCECEPTSLDDTSTSTTGLVTTGSSGSGTTVVDATTGTTSDSTTSDSTTGEPSVCDMYVTPPGQECDVWLQDCPAGEKCMPWANDGGTSWNSTRCSPLDPAPGGYGDPCTVVGSGSSGVDDCGLGLMCWDVDTDTLMGTCNELCSGCPDDSYCNEAGNLCVITNDGFLPICLPGCDPILQDCPVGQGCYPVENAFLCAPDASGAGGQYGDACAYINVCDPGLVCLSSASVPGCAGPGCCTEICDITDPSGDAQCSGEAAGQMCQAWYPMGTAPAGYEDVGACSL